MKACPKCYRQYLDETLNFCLDDGEHLLDGPATAILSERVGHSVHPSEEPTKEFNRASDTNSSDGGASNKPDHLTSKRNWLIAGAAGFLIATALGVGSYWYYSDDDDDARRIDSIAVMPFENASGDPETEYLSEGLTDSLVYRLSQVADLKVSPATSVARYKGKEIDPIKVGNELGISSVLVGRITQRGDSLVVSANLIDVRNEQSLWGELYDRKLSDLLATQREIAREIAEALKIQVSREQGITKTYTNSNEAYLLQLQGRFHLEKRTRQEMDRAITCFQKAILLDPNFALAYVGIADTYNAMVPYGYMKPSEGFTEARAAAKRALEIDPLLAEAHSAYAFVIGSYDWNWAEAEREHKRAIELSPNREGPYFYYATGHLIPVGRFEEAEAMLRKAIQIEPNSIRSNGRLATTLRYARRFDEGLAQARKANDLDPGSLANRGEMISALTQKGLYDEAIRIGEESLVAAPDYPQVLTALSMAYARGGRQNDARKKLAEWETTWRSQAGYSSRVARIYIALGERENAFEALQKAVDNRDFILPRERASVEYDDLREDPRFIDLMRRMNLPDLNIPTGQK